MQDKQKVTLYIPADLHRQLKIQSAIDAESMSEIAERALAFYLNHADVVAEVDAGSQGDSHLVYACPGCSTSVVMQSGQLVPLSSETAVLSTDDLSLSSRSLDPVLSARS
ncbi:MAG: hypothetical protein AAGB01_07875 [Cyanobacteria bacterium P01_F01_bin.42]